MEYETHDKDSLPASLRYAVRGTGPTAEAAHGRYLRRVTRYLQSKRPVQWLIVTEAIRRPEAPAANTPAQDSDTDSGQHENASDAALQAAYEAGRLERDAANQRLSAEIDEILERQRRRRRRKKKTRRKKDEKVPSLARVLKTVRQLSVTLHSAEQFQALSYTVQRELYDFSSARLYAFLMRSLGEEWSHIIPSDSVPHADGLQCWRVLRLRMTERSSSSEAYWLQAFMRVRFNATGTRG